MRKNQLPKFMTRVPNEFLVSGELIPIVRHWILHMLVAWGGMRDFVREHGFHDENLVVALGLGSGTDEEEEYADFNRKAVCKELRKRYKQSQLEGVKAVFPPTFSGNIRKVADLVGLSAVDCRLLEFAVMIKMDTRLYDAAAYLGDMASTKAFQVLSTTLELDEHDVRKALHPAGLLARSGLVTVDREGNDTLGRKLDLLSHSFADVLFSAEAEPLELLRDTVIASKPATITLEDYQQISRHLEILLPYVRQSLVQRKKGVNILLYGPPGVGKTQLARVISRETSTELFEISSEDLDGDPVEGSRRLASLRAAQCFLSGRQSLLLFDEVEDIFAGGGFFSPRSIADKFKAWMNRMLEENPVPTFWLSNDIHNLDPAFLRRFDMVVEVGWPTRTQRRDMLQRQCGDFIEAAVIERIADTDNLAPAVIERAVSIIRAVKDTLPETRVPAALELLVNDTLETQGHRRIASHNPNKVPEIYDPAFINADKDLSGLLDGIRASGSARLCLYGPPGTGKTAFGKYLAESLDKPLLVKRGSDLLSMWVGGTEKNIAKAFEEATREEAILLIDEVDSFLQDRRGSSHSWEVTEVNEMLTQMETFNGIFIASTNLMAGLDQAALRRFDLKVEFGYLQQEQAWQLFNRYCEKLCLAVGDKLRPRLNALTNLTPGDFAAVGRQNRFSPLQTAEDLLQALNGECHVKENAPGKGIGFIRH